MMCQPNCGLHRRSVISPFFSDHGLRELGRRLGRGEVRSPPSRRSPDPGVLLRGVLELGAALDLAISALASSSFSTRMWRARYSVPPDWPLNLSYSAWTSASVTGFLLRVKSANSSRIRMRLARRTPSAACTPGVAAGRASRLPAGRSRAAPPRRAPAARARASWAGWLDGLRAAVVDARLGTALPLTMAMFCACAAVSRATSSGRGRQRTKGSWAEGSFPGVGKGVRVVGAGVDGQGVDARGSGCAGIINDAMPRHP